MEKYKVTIGEQTTPENELSNCLEYLGKLRDMGFVKLGLELIRDKDGEEINSKKEDLKNSRQKIKPIIIDTKIIKELRKPNPISEARKAIPLVKMPVKDIDRKEVKKRKRRTKAEMIADGEVKKPKVSEKKSYPKEMREFVEENMDGKSNEELCTLINSKFDVRITKMRIAAYMQYHKLKRGKKSEEKKIGKPKKYTDEVVKFLRENINNFSTKLLCEELDYKFNIKTNVANLQGVISQKGIKRDAPVEEIDPKISEFVMKSKEKEVYALRDDIIEKFEVYLPMDKLRNLMGQREEKLSGEDVDDEVKRVQEQREEPVQEFFEDDEDVDGMDLDN